MFWLFDCQACGILAHCPGIKPTPPALEGEVLTTELPGKSLAYLLNKIVKVLVTQSCLTPWIPARQALCPWDSPSKNSGFGCHVLLQGIFPTQGSNLGLLLAGTFFNHLSHQASQNSNRRKNNDSVCSCLCSKTRDKAIWSPDLSQTAGVQAGLSLYFICGGRKAPSS